MASTLDPLKIFVITTFSATMSSSWSDNEVRSLIVPSGESIPEDFDGPVRNQAQFLHRKCTAIQQRLATM